MSPGLRPYRTYGDSGAQWLGEIPDHWQVLRLKRAATLNPSRSEIGGLVPPSALVTFLPMERVSVDGRIDASDIRPLSSVSTSFTYMRRDDVIAAKITPCFENGKGACLDFLPTEIGFGSTEFHVLRAQSSILPRFLYRIVTTPSFRQLGTEAMRGAAGQQRVPASFVADFQIALPPLPEQRAIVRYLDFVDRRIRRYVRAKRKLIKLLEEQKQAIIQQTVTRGLDPNVRLKPSGVEWLGDVPEHWEVKRAKFLLREIDERSATGEEELLSVSHLTGVTPRREKTVTMFKAESYVGHKICRPGDIAVNTMWVWMGALGVSRFGGIVSPSYAVYRLHEVTAFHPTYLDNLLRAKPYVSEYVRQSTGIRASRLRFYPDQFLRLPLVQPPYQEQVEIAARLDDEGRGITEAIAKIESQISLLQEYRTRLIADVVTGKLDVREAAARLPEEPEEAEPVDEDEALDEDVELDEDPEAGDEEE